MKRDRRVDLRDAGLVGVPAVRPATTAAQYVAALKTAIVSEKHAVSVKVFERWLRRQGLDRVIAADETLLEHFRRDMQSGRIRSEDGRKYRSLSRQAPTDIYQLHNAAASNGGLVARPLIDARQYGRLQFVAGLTETTRKALVWFHEKAACTKSRPGRPQMMTQATRDGALGAAFTLLRRLGVNGLELVRSSDVDLILPDPDDDDPEYRRAVHILREAATIYRACCKEGFLPSNPLAAIPNSKFTAQAQRDFLPPTEVDRVRDLSTVEMGDWLQVRDRLVILLLIDTAMRKSELAAVRLPNVRLIEDCSYQITLPPESQKMRGKTTAYLGVIYPETNRLLAHYLEHIRPRFGGAALIVDSDGRDASPFAVYNAVVREAERLGLECHFSGGIPGCHDLRRTFATVNAAPLGLRLTGAELADRMRASYEVVNQHYVLRNPLRSAMSDAEYRKRIAADPVQEIAAHIDALGRLGITQEALASVRLQVETLHPRPGVQAQHQKVVEWVSEASALELLRAGWGVSPAPRTLRSFWRKEGVAKKRSGAHGKVHVDAAVIHILAADYVPLSAVLRGHKGVSGAILEKYTVKMVGRLRLMRRIDAVAALNDLIGSRVGNSIPSANCQTGADETVKQASTGRTEQHQKVA